MRVRTTLMLDPHHIINPTDKRAYPSKNKAQISFNNHSHCPPPSIPEAEYTAETATAPVALTTCPPHTTRCTWDLSGKIYPLPPPWPCQTPGMTSTPVAPFIATKHATKTTTVAKGEPPICKEYATIIEKDSITSDRIGFRQIAINLLIRTNGASRSLLRLFSRNNAEGYRYIRGPGTKKKPFGDLAPIATKPSLAAIITYIDRPVLFSNLLSWSPTSGVLLMAVVSW